VRVLVVGAAIVRGGRLLACRRTSPPEAANRWELPGGKVEEGESPDEALVREVREELGLEIQVTRWLAAEAVVRDGVSLRAALATITSGEPAPVEHDAVRWLAPHELDDVDWLDPDRPFLDELRVHLSSLVEVRAERASKPRLSDRRPTLEP
jgi:8-oxo-dGTP diphosphatase